MRGELRDSLVFLCADSAVADPPRRTTRLDVARGGTAAVHLLLLRGGENGSALSAHTPTEEP